MNDLIITEYNNVSFLAQCVDCKVMSLEVLADCNRVTSDSIVLGNIYIGKIENIVRNINAAFVKINEDKVCYLSLDKVSNAIFTKKQSDTKISEGDELVVQIIKDEVKTKACVVSTDFEISGKNVVLTHGRKGIQFSKKITESVDRSHLADLFSTYDFETYGLLIRTNAVYANDEEIIKEFISLKKQYDFIASENLHNTKYTLIHKELPSYLVRIRNASPKTIDRILTDNKEIYDDIVKYISEFSSMSNGENKCLIEFEKEKGSLAIRYKIGSALERAGKRTIFLKSGGTLVIDVAEAMTVIDVNTGKAIEGKKQTEDIFFKINTEAAEEIAEQLILRNISGMIIVDFINMTKKEHVEKLVSFLKEKLKSDPVQTEYVDITKLGLVELTRKKVYKTLKEQLQNINFDFK